MYKGVHVPGMCGIQGYGRYEDVCSLTPEGWRISFSRLTRTRIDAIVTPPVTPHYDVVAPDRSWIP